jgi:hypothetical protein
LLQVYLALGDVNDDVNVSIVVLVATARDLHEGIGCTGYIGKTVKRCSIPKKVPWNFWPCVCHDHQMNAQKRRRQENTRLPSRGIATLWPKRHDMWRFASFFEKNAHLHPPESNLGYFFFGMKAALKKRSVKRDRQC